MRWSEAMGSWFTIRIPLWWSGRALLPRWMRRAGGLANWPPSFAGPADFVGSFTPRGGPVEHGLQSTYSGAIVVTEVDRAIVQQMLPPGLVLATPQAGTGTTRHPVLHMVGQQRSPSTLLFGVPTPVPGAAGYDEMILVVPFVRRANGVLWHNWVARMYLTDSIAVFGGNEVFGYQKVIARLPRVDAPGAFSYTVQLDNPTTTMFHDTVSVTQPASTGAAAAALPRWNDVVRILQMPFLGTLPDGTQVCSHWELDFGNATVAPAESRHQVFHKFRSGMETWETLGPLHNARDGAFVVSQVRWRLGWLQPVQGC